MFQLPELSATIVELLVALGLL